MRRGIRYQIPIVPDVYHYVMGRKMFGKESRVIKASWKVGRYWRPRQHFKRPYTV
jgi:hypothetical protein